MLRRIFENQGKNICRPHLIFHNHPFPTPNIRIHQNNMVVLCSTLGRGSVTKTGLGRCTIYKYTGDVWLKCGKSFSIYRAEKIDQPGSRSAHLSTGFGDYKKHPRQCRYKSTGEVWSKSAKLFSSYRPDKPNQSGGRAAH
jgi:hypothetical protein